MFLRVTWFVLLSCMCGWCGGAEPTTAEDPAKVFAAVKQQAEAGDVDAQYRLGSLYSRGSGTEKSDEQALIWFRKVADRGDPRGQSMLGVFYTNARAVPRDYTEAMKWFRLAEAQNSAHAQYNLGHMYSTGKGVEKSDAESAAWYRKAAEQNEVNSQRILGGMYGTGRGVPRDLVQAWAWTKVSTGTDAAIAAPVRQQLDKLAEQLTPEQQAAAEKLAGEIAARVRASKSSQRPNVIVILADDLGYGDLGCYGHPKFKTPRLDRMAQEGVRLTHCNTPMPYCAPTRAALMTGRYPLRCGMIGNPAPDGGARWDNFALPKEEQTLAELLKRENYATGLIGKWHLGHKPGTLPTDRGFDEYFGIPYSNDMRPVHVLEGTKVVEFPVEQTTLTERYTRRAVDFIQRNKERPFFLYFAMVMPHKPLAAADEFYKKSGAGLYGDVIAELDASVGRVLDTLRDCGIDDRTLVIFSSDNGPWFGGSTGGLRGMKAASWEGGYRVPLIARWPGKVERGIVRHELVATMDIFSTVLSATGTKPPTDRVLDGRDLLPLLRGDAKPPREFLFAHHGEKLVAVRDGRWKLHVERARAMTFKTGPDGRWVDPRGPDGKTILAPTEQYNVDALPGVPTGVAPAAMQLFDLANDPGEQQDVAAKHPAEVTRLKAAFDAMEQELAANNKGR